MIYETERRTNKPGRDIFPALVQRAARIAAKEGLSHEDFTRFLFGEGSPEGFYENLARQFIGHKKDYIADPLEEFEAYAREQLKSIKFDAANAARMEGGE